MCLNVFDEGFRSLTAIKGSRCYQIPLHKGKDTCPLDPNSYQGITLLSDSFT